MCAWVGAYHFEHHQLLRHAFTAVYVGMGLSPKVFDVHADWLKNGGQSEHAWLVMEGVFDVTPLASPTNAPGRAQPQTQRGLLREGPLNPKLCCSNMSSVNTK